MTRKEELIAEANGKWKEKQVIKALEGEFLDYQNSKRTSDKNYRFSHESRYFHYDSEADTLCNWGNGMGLIYAKGQWAGDPPVENTYSIY